MLIAWSKVLISPPPTPRPASVPASCAQSPEQRPLQVPAPLAVAAGLPQPGPDGQEWMCLLTRPQVP